MRKYNSSEKIYIRTFGCPKNLVDSEKILGHLKKKKYKISFEIDNCDVAIVNTCSFIRKATQESIDAILDLCELRKKGRIKGLVVCGCLPQRYSSSNLGKELEEVDAFIGVGDFDRIPDLISRVLEGEKISFIRGEPGPYFYENVTPIPLTLEHSKYIKISDGCDHKCTFCVIPAIKGAYKSRKISHIVDEVDSLSRSGKLKEINLIGQDTNLYGIDLYGKPSLGKLLKKLSEKRVDWIRTLYFYPNFFNDELIKVIAGEENICKYVDIPIQHISDRILRRMKRGVRKKDMVKLIDKLRNRIPDLCLRTSVIVGFPGETKKDFKELVNFVEEVKFDRLGVFEFSREEGTKAYDMPGQVHHKVKESRANEIMKVQREISLKKNDSKVGSIVKVLIDGIEEGVLIGRTKHDAPDIDGKVFIDKGKRKIEPGSFVEVEVTGVSEYDLFGVVL